MKGSTKQLSTLLDGVDDPMVGLFVNIITDAIEMAKYKLYIDIDGKEYKSYYQLERDFIFDEELGLTLYANVLYRLLEMDRDGRLMARIAKREVLKCPEHLQGLPTKIL